jgi:phosphate/sulfate permease
MSKGLIAVCGGGLLGGVFWLLTQIAGAATLDLPVSVYLYALIGGIIAAGLATYVPADVDHSKVERMFFISAAAGLSFPSIISTAVTAEDVAQIRGTNKQVERKVEALREQIRSDTTDPAQVAQAIREAGARLSSSPASADVKQSYDAVSRNAVESLGAQAAQSPDPQQYVQAIEQIATVNPQLRDASTAQLIELSRSDKPELSAVARPALERQLNRLPFEVKEAAAATDAPAVARSQR